MRAPLHDKLIAELSELDEQSLRRVLHALPAAGPRIDADGQPLLNFASNDYLGLSQHPHLKAAVREAVERYGVGSGASRLICGHLDIHEQLEHRFTAFKHRGDDAGTLLFPTGYMANLAVLTALAGPDDLILLDKLCHASLIDGARASGAKVRAFRHLDYNHLETLLRKKSEIRNSTVSTATNVAKSEIILVTDSVFSMDGDCADLPAVCDLAQRYGAVTIVDEAHATGVLGDTGAGLCELQSVTDRVDIIVSTASKALGSLGGMVTASRPIIDTLINKARPFIYTTAVPPAQPAAINAALDVIRDEPWRRQRLAELSTLVRRAIGQAPADIPAKFDIRNSTASTAAHAAKFEIRTAIIPLITGTPESALALADHLRTHGILAVAIRPPTVAPHASRVRLSLRCDLGDADVARLGEALADWPVGAA